MKKPKGICMVNMQFGTFENAGAGGGYAANLFFTNVALKGRVLPACCPSLGRLNVFKKEGFFNSCNMETKNRLYIPTFLAEFTNIPADRGRLSRF